MKNLTAKIAEDGMVIEPSIIMITVIEEVKPADGSPVLPKGTYQAHSLRWIAWRTSPILEAGEPFQGMATFALAGDDVRRRVGIILLDKLDRLDRSTEWDVRKMKWDIVDVPFHLNEASGPLGELP